MGTRSRLPLVLGCIALLVVGMILTVPLAGQAKVATPVEIDMGNNQCNVSASPTTCGGAFTATRTFRDNLSVGDVVTVTFSYLYGNNASTVLSFNDSLGNTPVLVSSGCANSTPGVCTAVGYFRVTSAGTDDVFFTEQGGATGEMWLNAEIWQGPMNPHIGAVGTSSSCAQSCSGSLSLGPLVNASGSSEVIAVNQYTAFYSSTPAAWNATYYYWYKLTDSIPTGGDSILWQASTTIAQSYTFGATTIPTPLIWAGSSELIYWS